MQADTLNPPDVVWWPDRSTVDNANLTRFMRALGVDSFEALNHTTNIQGQPAAVALSFSGLIPRRTPNAR